jgi:hypothetical protein
MTQQLADLQCTRKRAQYHRCLWISRSVHGELLNWAKISCFSGLIACQDARCRHFFRSFDRHRRPASPAGRPPFRCCRIRAGPASIADPQSRAASVRPTCAPRISWNHCELWRNDWYESQSPDLTQGLPCVRVVPHQCDDAEQHLGVRFSTSDTGLAVALASALEQRCSAPSGLPGLEHPQDRR